MTDNYYEILGIEKNASQDAVKKAYRQKAMIHHPDKGGDKETFQKLSEAYEILSDVEKRELYNKHGADYFKKGGGNGGGNAHAHAQEIFESMMKNAFGGGGAFGGGFNFGSFFGMGGGGPQQKQKLKTPDINSEIQLTLEEIYFGCKKGVKLIRNKRCATCEGTGSLSKAREPCTGCGGKGVKIEVQINGSMMMQRQTGCGECGGKKFSIKDKCSQCSGECVSPVEEFIEIEIAQGVKHGDKIILKNYSNEPPNTYNEHEVESGDFILTINQLPHQIFTRDGDDLRMRKKITLTEALTGFEFLINHIDPKKKAKLIVNDVIHPNTGKQFDDMGMPVQNTKKYGKLIIEFEIDFPKSVKNKVLLKETLVNCLV